MKTAQLVQDGQGQMVRLPDEYKFQGNAVRVNRVGSCLILMPEHGDPWRQMFEASRRFSPDFMSERDQGRQSGREGFDT